MQFKIENKSKLVIILIKRLKKLQMLIKYFIK